MSGPPLPAPASAPAEPAAASTEFKFLDLHALETCPVLPQVQHFTSLPVVLPPALPLPLAPDLPEPLELAGLPPLAAAPPPPGAQHSLA